MSRGRFSALATSAAQRLAPILKVHLSGVPMTRLPSTLLLIGALSLGTGLSGAASSAARGGESVQPTAQFRSRLSDRQLQTILARIRTNTEQLLRTVDGTPPRGRAWGN